MPQAKKAKKKVNSSRLSKVANWLTPNTPKKGLLLFIVAFAIAGGGYAVYKSHAATLTNYYTKIQNYSASTIIKDTASQDKYAPKVWDLIAANSAVQTYFSIPSNPASVSYTPCVTIRRPQNVNIVAGAVEITASKTFGTGGGDTISVPSSDLYSSYCIKGYLTYNPSETGITTVRVTNKSAGSIYVQSIYLGYK